VASRLIRTVAHIKTLILARFDPKCLAQRLRYHWHKTNWSIQHESYLVRAKAIGLNTGKLKVGQKAIVRLSNYPDREFGVLEGKLVNISKIPDGEGFLILEIELSKQLTTSFGIELEFQQEMTGSAEIVTEDLRLLERLFYQLRDLTRRTPNFTNRSEN